MAAGIRQLAPGEDPSMLSRFSFLIRENQQRGSQLGGLGVMRPSEWLGIRRERSAIVSQEQVKRVSALRLARL
jgi:hypothetical protein